MCGTAWYSVVQSVLRCTGMAAIGMHLVVYKVVQFGVDCGAVWYRAWCGVAV